ncbi:MAG: hypothetical protein KC613_21165 [Myxococcales bacterium]|nr:hypothetical protein [Myxococcales bacterium]MCB9523052.1 hypothetical protein [Myxococcales bacterium]
MRRALLALALIGCGGAPGVPSAPAPASRSATVRVPPPVPIDARLVRRLASMPNAVKAAVDPRVGVLWIQVYTDTAGDDPHAGPDGVVRTAERLCGAALTPRLATLQRDLKARHGEGIDPQVTCDDPVCRYPAQMEYDLAGQLTFAHAPVGPRLVQVVQVEGGPVTPEFTSAAYAWAGQQIRALAGGRCP